MIKVSTVPTAQHPAIVRTAKAEKRLKDRLQREVTVRSDATISIWYYVVFLQGLELSEEEKKLSPNEQRALQVLGLFCLSLDMLIILNYFECLRLGSEPRGEKRASSLWSRTPCRPRWLLRE